MTFSQFHSLLDFPFDFPGGHRCFRGAPKHLRGRKVFGAPEKCFAESVTGTTIEGHYTVV
jgi:hypothetical protein